MSRSIKKGPFIESRLLGRIEQMNKRNEKKVVKTWSRASVIFPSFIGHTVAVYNGRKHVPVYVTENMVGHRPGAFAPTRPYPGPGKAYFSLDGRWGAVGTMPQDILTTSLFPFGSRLRIVPLMATIRFTKVESLAPWPVNEAMWGHRVVEHPRAGQIEVGAKHPARVAPSCFGDEGPDGGGLRVVDDDDIELLSKELGVHSAVA